MGGISSPSSRTRARVTGKPVAGSSTRPAMRAVPVPGCAGRSCPVRGCHAEEAPEAPSSTATIARSIARMLSRLDTGARRMDRARAPRRVVKACTKSDDVSAFATNILPAAAVQGAPGRLEPPRLPVEKGKTRSCGSGEVARSRGLLRPSFPVRIEVYCRRFAEKPRRPAGESSQNSRACGLHLPPRRRWSSRGGSYAVRR